MSKALFLLPGRYMAGSGREQMWEGDNAVLGVDGLSWGLSLSNNNNNDNE